MAVLMAVLMAETGLRFASPALGCGSSLALPSPC
jgi:hypothetical protein